MPRKDQVRSAMMDAARAIIDADGFDRVSVRALADRTAYSSSSVGQYVLPMERFMTDMWMEVHHDSVQSVYQQFAGTPDWAEQVSRTWLAWARQHPRTADFFVRYLPTLDYLRLDATTCGVDPDVWAASEGALADAWYSSTRALQASCGLAMSQDQATAVAMMATDLDEIGKRWQRLVATISERSVPPVPTAPTH